MAAQIIDDNAIAKSIRAELTQSSRRVAGSMGQSPAWAGRDSGR